MTIVTTGQITIADLNDGLNAYLTQDACLVATNADGSGGNYAIANSTMVIRQGNVDVSALWTVTASPGAGVTGALSVRTYAVSAMSVDTGFVDLTAAKQGETPITLRFTITKARQGVTGDRGTITASRAIAGTAWSDAEAQTAIADAGGGSPARGDVVTLFNTGANWSQTRVRTTGGTWALLAAFFGGDVLVDGTVVANKLAANSVTANKIEAGAIGAVHMQAGSVLASKITLTDFTNLVPDAEFAEIGTTWSNPAGTVTAIPAPSSDWNTPVVLRILSPGTSRTSAGRVFPVNSGETLFFQHEAQVVAGAGNITGQVQFSATADFAALLQTVSVAISSTTRTRAQETMVVPATARFARIRFVQAAGVDDAYVGTPILRRAASAELIVDGAITTLKLAAGAVSAEKLQAGSVLASKIAVTDFTNLVPDGEMLDSAAWTIPADWAMAPSSAFSSAGGLTYTYAGGSGNGSEALSRKFAIEEGKSYRFQYQTDGVATYRIQGQVVWFDAAGAAIGSPSAIDFSTTTGLQNRGADFSPPTGARTAALSFLVGRGNTTGNCSVGGVSCRLRMGGELIVDGAITAAKVGANEVIALTANIKDGLITNAKIADLSAAKLTAGTALASTITVNGTTLDLVEGRAADPAARINIVSTQIDPGKIVISGATTLADWRRGGDDTRIDGGAISANTIDANRLTIGSRNITVTGVTFDYNSPGANQVSWTAGHVRWINDTGTAVSTAISAGNATWSSGVRYIWFDKTGTLKTGTNIATAFAAENFVLATYMGGANLVTDYGRTVIDGSSIKTGTIDVTKLVAGQIITDSMIVAGAVARKWFGHKVDLSTVSDTKRTLFDFEFAGAPYYEVSGRAANPIVVDLRGQIRPGTTSSNTMLLAVEGSDDNWSSFTTLQQIEVAWAANNQNNWFDFSPRLIDTTAAGARGNMLKSFTTPYAKYRVTQIAVGATHWAQLAPGLTLIVEQISR